MAVDPRKTFYFEELDAHFTAIGADGTVNLPTIGVLGETQSTDLGIAVTLVNANTAAPQVGKDAANGELFGKVKTVDEDGTCTVQDRGYMTIVPTGGAPAVGAPVGVDGTGKVQSTAANKQAFFCGVIVDPQGAGTLWVVRKI